MSIKKLILFFFVGITLIACSNDNEISQINIEGVPTYVNLSITLPSSKTKAPVTDPGDYNEDGEYAGKDYIKTLDIYIQSDGIIEDAIRFERSDLSINTNTGIISPSQPFRTNSGSKIIYVVINNPAPLGTSITQEDELISINKLASLYTNNGITYDQITMTGKTESTVYIEPDILIQDVTTGKNHFSVAVNRVASKVIVTMVRDGSRVLRDDNDNPIGEVSNITWSVAQGTQKIYWIGQPDYSTFGTDYIPTLGGTPYADAINYYDYSDLSNNTAIPFTPDADDGYKSYNGKFLFENTHAEGDIKTTQYRKGNTAYVLVKAKFTPATNVIDEGLTEKGSLIDGTFYVGQSDGKIYSSKAKAQEGVLNQKVIKYEKGKMLNFAWLNPDDVTKPLNSPVVRNHIYHIKITGFNRLAYNYNPLVPPGVTNPDPKPEDPDEPDSSIDPLDPLTPEQTYMSVDVEVLNWTTHSYEIEF